MKLFDRILNAVFELPTTIGHMRYEEKRRRQKAAGIPDYDWWVIRFTSKKNEHDTREVFYDAKGRPHAVKMFREKYPAREYRIDRVWRSRNKPV